MDIDNLVAESITELEEEKAETEQKISLIQSLDWSKPVTEDTWHELCETPIRYSPLLEVLVTNIFPAATNIVRTANYVNFELYGYKVQIPTDRSRGINVATDWYNPTYIVKICRSPVHLSSMIRLKEYFNAIDNHLGWKAEATARCNIADKKSAIWLFFWWFGKHKWKNVDRAKFEEMWGAEEERYNKKTKEIEEKDAQNKKHLEFIRDTLLPEVNKFSTKHLPYYGANTGAVAIEELFERENIEI